VGSNHRRTDYEFAAGGCGCFRLIDTWALECGFQPSASALVCGSPRVPGNRGPNDAVAGVRAAGCRRVTSFARADRAAPRRRGELRYRRPGGAGRPLFAEPSLFSRWKIVWGSFGIEPGAGTLVGLGGVGGLSRRGEAMFTRLAPKLATATKDGQPDGRSSPNVARPGDRSPPRVITPRRPCLSHPRRGASLRPDGGKAPPHALAR
jgi:hypothetical protein